MGFTMAKDLEGTVALVTGASSGIGEATAFALAQRGAKVAVAARRRAKLEALRERIEAAGGTALVLDVDVTVQEQASYAVEETAARLGRLDILINNAGVMLLGPIPDADIGEWKRMLDLNVNGVLYCTNAALPFLKTAAEQGPRRVSDLVNISSVAGRVARAGAGVYNASKFAVGAFSEALRQEVTRQHVRVALVEPGLVDTELRSHNRPEIQEQITKSLPDTEPLLASDIADAILYVVTRPRHVAVNEVLIRPTEQMR